jgi:hypothetical protein
MPTLQSLVSSSIFFFHFFFFPFVIFFHTYNSLTQSIFFLLFVCFSLSSGASSRALTTAALSGVDLSIAVERRLGQFVAPTAAACASALAMAAADGNGR